MAGNGLREDQEGDSGQSLAEREAKLHGYQGPDRIVDYLEFLREKGVIDATIKKFSTGFTQLDFFLDSVETGELIVVTGPTGNGKTLLTETLGRNFMDQGVRICWFSYEVPTVRMLEKYRTMGGVGLYVPLELKAGDFSWIVDRCLEAKIKFDCRVVFVDHLHYLVDMSAAQNMSLNIGGVLRQMKKNIAVGMNMVVVLIAHQGMQKNDDIPSLSGARDSSFIGQEADTGLTVYRTPDPTDNKAAESTYEQGWATVKVDKARRAGTYRKKITFQKNGHWLKEF